MTSASGIYTILERLIKKAGDTPVTCLDLFDDPDVKQYAKTSNRVSDFLGHMWRRGLLQRWTAANDLTTRARYAYTWKDSTPQKLDTPAVPLKVIQNALSKPNVTITEEDSRIVLDFADFTITVQSKRK